MSLPSIVIPYFTHYNCYNFTEQIHHLFTLIARAINGVGWDGSSMPVRGRRFDVRFTPVSQFGLLDDDTVQCADFIQLVDRIYRDANGFDDEKQLELQTESGTPSLPILSTLPLLVIIPIVRDSKYICEFPQKRKLHYQFPNMKVIFIDSVFAGKQGILEREIPDSWSLKAKLGIFLLDVYKSGNYISLEDLKSTSFNYENVTRKLMDVMPNPYHNIPRLKSYTEQNLSIGSFASFVWKEYCEVTTTTVFPRQNVSIRDGDSPLMYDNLLAPVKQRADEFRARASVIEYFYLWIIDGPENEKAMREILSWIDSVCGAGVAEIKANVAEVINEHIGVYGGGKYSVGSNIASTVWDYLDLSPQQHTSLETVSEPVLERVS